MNDPLTPRLKEIELKLQSAFATIPAKAGAIIVRESDRAFRNQGWTDEGLEPWTPRKSQDAKGKGRAILIKTGRLRRSIRVVQVTTDSVTVGTDVPYARIHNEGGSMHHYARGAILNFNHAPTNARWSFGKANTVRQQRGIKAIRRVTFKEFDATMPRRKFLGNSHQLTTYIASMINTEVLKALKR